MLVEIPSFRRCCCCLPLRRGILAFAYINLIITIFFGALQLALLMIFSNLKTHFVMYRGVVIEAQMFFLVALHVLDVIFGVVLIVGAHMKNCKLMLVYYYYQITTLIANFLMMMVTIIDTGIDRWEAVISELAVAFIGFVVQIYLLLLIRSELNKQRYQEGRTCFVNQMSEVYLEPPLRHDRRIFL